MTDFRQTPSSKPTRLPDAATDGAIVAGSPDMRHIAPGEFDQLVAWTASNSTLIAIPSFDRLAQMVASGEFPSELDDTMTRTFRNLMAS